MHGLKGFMSARDMNNTDGRKNKIEAIAKYGAGDEH